MKKNLKITPEGTKDFLFAECSAMDDVCGRIENNEEIFWLTRLQNNVMPVRLYYKQAVYRNNPTLTGRSNELMQMGVELLGVKGIRADLEIITTAVKALSAVASDFRVELGHAGVFDALSDELDITENEKEKIRLTIEGKNYSALNNLLDKLEPCQAVSAIRSLPSLFGGEEVFDKAKSICRGTKASAALDYLHKIYTSLLTMGLGDKLIIDLGIVQRNDYYTGIVFTGYINGIGDAVLSGGRYDELLSEFDMPMGAAGFAVDTDAVTMKTLSDANVSYSDNPDVLVFAGDGCEMQAIALAEVRICSR